jgi:type I restriction enzyme S subunit
MLGKSAAYLKAKNINKTFLFVSLQTSNVMNNFMLSLTGTTIKNLGLESIKSTTILVPENEEQEKIGTYFSNLDHLITLHQRK